MLYVVAALNGFDDGFAGGRKAARLYAVAAVNIKIANEKT
jgi:hypothetical protein